MEIEKIFETKVFKAIIFIVLALMLLLSAFLLGFSLGERKAEFFGHWNNSYAQNFAGPKCGSIPMPGGRELIESHGLAGQIIKIDGNSLVIKGRGDVEQIVNVDEETVVNYFNDKIKSSDLKVNDMIVVIGNPNDAGQIEAKLIRVLPAPPQQFDQSGIPTSTIIK